MLRQPVGSRAQRGAPRTPLRSASRVPRASRTARQIHRSWTATVELQLHSRGSAVARRISRRQRSTRPRCAAARGTCSQDVATGVPCPSCHRTGGNARPAAANLPQPS
eukprot:11212298-Lingulodinium_polyedra.AAC.1